MTNTRSWWDYRGDYNRLSLGFHLRIHTSHKSSHLSSSAHVYLWREGPCIWKKNFIIAQETLEGRYSIFEVHTIPCFPTTLSHIIYHFLHSGAHSFTHKSNQKSLPHLKTFFNRLLLPLDIFTYLILSSSLFTIFPHISCPPHLNK